MSKVKIPQVGWIDVPIIVWIITSNVRENCTTSENLITNTDSLNISAGYLLNSFDVYVKYEPCIMCAMALVHSRVSRVFFNKPSSKGALQTLAKLHIMEELNHTFEVYKMTEIDEIKLPS